MASISIKQEDQIEGTSNFNTWNARVLNFLNENDLYAYMNSMREETLCNDGWIQEKVG